MKHSIKREDVKYFVNEEKRTVVAVLEGTKCLFTDFIYENDGLMSFHDHYYDFDNRYLLPNRFVGIAKCSVNDEWNEQLGKLIAFDRLKEKVNNSFVKCANKYVEDIDKSINTFCNNTQAYLNKLASNSDRRRNLINQLIKED